MLSKIKIYIARIISRYRLRKRINSLKDSDSPYILLNVPSHGNLGDHLISYAEQELLSDLTDKRPIVFSTGDLFYGYDIILKFINKSHILLVTGGGFLGSIWPEEELRIRKLIHDCRNNKIILLPQTLYYGKDADSKTLLSETRKIYAGHLNLKIIARESESYRVLKEDLKLSDKQVSLMPDMALYLNFESKVQRNGVLFCFRDDKEKLPNNNGLELIRRTLSPEKPINCIDTQVPYAVSRNMEKEEIMKLVDKFSAAELVVTDRLHGMIYAVITGTPVIAFDNSSHKIKNVYETWLKGNPNIYFVGGDMNNSKEVAEFLKNSKCYSTIEFNKEIVSKLRDLKKLL